MNTRDSKDKVEVLIVMKGGEIEYVATTGHAHNVAVLERFENTPVPLVTESKGHVMTKDKMTDIVVSSIAIGNEVAKQEKENKDEQAEEDNQHHCGGEPSPEADKGQLHSEERKLNH